MIDLKDLTIEELLELAKDSTGDADNQDISKHVLDFIKDYKITSGVTLVPTYLIYYTYRRVWRFESRTKMSKIDFFRNFGKLYEQKRTTTTRYYLLNEECFDLSEENLTKTKKADKLYEKTRKKENSKESK